MKRNVPKPDGPESVKYQGKLIELVHQPMKIGDKKTIFEFARRSPGTRTIIHDVRAGKILITKEYRPELKDWDYRLPGGKVFDSLEEWKTFVKGGKNIVDQAKKAATKEVQEEAGLDVKDLELFATSHAGLTIQWDLYYFVSKTFNEIPAGQNLEDGEDIELMWMTESDVWKLCLTGKIQEDRTTGVLLRYLHSLSKEP